jgi:hypothetical protein
MPTNRGFYIQYAKFTLFSNMVGKLWPLVSELSASEQEWASFGDHLRQSFQVSSALTPQKIPERFGQTWIPRRER